MASRPFLILVSGLPCTGKTTLAQKISKRFSLTLMTKDGIKEILFDHLGYGSRDWSKRLSLATYDLLFHNAAASLKAGNPVVLEANFSPAGIRQGLDTIRRQGDFNLLDVFCRTDGDVLIERFKERAVGGKRHPGHLDTVVLQEMEALVAAGDDGRLGLDCATLLVDTTQFEHLDMDATLAMIQRSMDTIGEAYG